LRGAQGRIEGTTIHFHAVPTAGDSLLIVRMTASFGPGESFETGAPLRTRLSYIYVA
jgi:hypothetical protein